MTMIAITNDVRINVEPTCVTIERRTVVETGKAAGEHRWLSVGFYGDVTGAAQALVGRHLGLVAGLGQDASLRELIAAVRQAARDVAAAVAKGAA